MKRSFQYFLFAVLAVLTAIPSVYASEAGQPEDKLVKIVVLSRHGVRSPTQNRTTLDQWSNKTWPRWPVRYGYLTERGHELVTAQWKAIRPVLTEQGLLPEMPVRLLQLHSHCRQGPENPRDRNRHFRRACSRLRCPSTMGRTI